MLENRSLEVIETLVQTVVPGTIETWVRIGRLMEIETWELTGVQQMTAM